MNSGLTRFCGLLFALVALSGGAGAAEPPRKKFIEVGWDIPDTQYLRENWQEMERAAPFDGLNFHVVAMPRIGQRVDSLELWDAAPWQYAWFEKCVEDLKSCRFRKFTDNWLRVDTTPGNLDWADDDGWKNLANKLGICARIAREGGAKGVCLDLEGYGVKSFRFDPAKKRTFAEAEKLARRRGAEAMKAMSAEFPDQILFTYWLNSVNAKSGRAARPDDLLANEVYGLQPAFINGLLDAMPERMTLVDGCEDGYYKDGALEYQRAAADMRQWHGPASRLVAPENRRKWRGQVQASFGFYLDMYLNPSDSEYYFPPLDGSRLRRLARNLAAARDAADEYVWVYGEQCNWWKLAESNDLRREDQKKSVGKGRGWEAAMPGLTAAIRSARDPDGAAWERVTERRAKGSPGNLVRNGDFASAGEDMTRPSDWDEWQDDDSHGDFVRDAATRKGAAKATKVKNGSLMQQHPVAAGQQYAVQVRCKREGATRANVLVRWKSAKGGWVRWDEDVALNADDPRDGWARFNGVVTVPENAHQLVILLAVSQQADDKDTCWFDDVELYAVPAPIFPDDSRRR